MHTHTHTQLPASKDRIGSSISGLSRSNSVDKRRPPSVAAAAGTAYHATPARPSFTLPRSSKSRFESATAKAPPSLATAAANMTSCPASPHELSAAPPPPQPATSAAGLLKQNQDLRQRLQDEAHNYRRRLDTYKQAQHNQAALVGRLQNKVLQYKQRCTDLEDRVHEVPLTPRPMVSLGRVISLV